MAGNRPVRPTRRVPEQALDDNEEDFLLDVAEEDLSIINENDSNSDETSSDASLSSYDSALVEPPMPEEDNPYTIDDALRAPVDAAIGEPELEALLAEGGRDLSVDRIVKLFPFPLDGFQKKALEKLVEGKSVVVCAPTGAGKTAIAEAASAATLARGQRVIYTTPLKALSNQKLAEVKKRFGVDRCGLQTGDTSLNTEADIVVMTTEILRNIMYRTAEISEERTGGGGSASSSNTREARLGNVGLVVLDEVHYLGDPSRGSVWEEVIINCPKHIQLLCMSATVKNPDDLGGWISQEHQECVTIKTTFRPVPLMWHFAYRNAGGVQVADLLDKTSKKLNPRLEPREVMFEEARFLLGREQGPPSRDWGRDKGRGGRGGRGGSNGSQGPSWEKRLQMMLDEEGGSSMMQRKVNMIRIPPMDGVISKLKRLGFLPAIWFILSRKDCDLNAIKAGQGGSLTTAEEQALILKEVEALQADQPEAVRDKLVPALIGGFASHHAGQLPGWKTLVEKLFQSGLCKIVFATGTLAAGINMPARTTIISALGRKTDDGVKLLPHNELLQMAGRAGRRGFDTIGHCVVVQNRFEGAEEACTIIQAGPEPLASQFTSSYGLVLNILSVYTLDEAKAFLLKSFGNYLQTVSSKRRKAEIEEMEAMAKEILSKSQDTIRVMSDEAKKLTAEVKVAKKNLQDLKAQAIQERTLAVEEYLQREGLPRRVVIQVADEKGDKDAAADKKRKKPSSGSSTFYLPCVIVGLVPEEEAVILREQSLLVAGAGALSGRPVPYYRCLGADNRLILTTAVHIVNVVEGEAGGIDPEDLAIIESCFGQARASAWTNIAKGTSTCKVQAGNAVTAKVSLRLSRETKKGRAIQNSKALVDELSKEKESYQLLTSRLQEVLQATSEEEPEGEVDGRGRSRKESSGQSEAAKARRMLKRAEVMRADLLDGGEESGLEEGTWFTFQAVMDVLITAGALEQDTLRILPLGQACRSFQGSNELWYAMALSHPAVGDLNPPQLAAFLGALLSADVTRKGSGSMFASYSTSDQVVKVVEALEPTRQLLFELQSDAGLSRWNDSLLVDLRLAGLVEAWAAGVTWGQIMEDSSMDDGDIARLLMRTTDLLRQVLNNAHLLPHLKETVQLALQGMERKPIAGF